MSEQYIYNVRVFQDTGAVEIVRFNIDSETPVKYCISCDAKNETRAYKSSVSKDMIDQYEGYYGVYSTDRQRAIDVAMEHVKKLTAIPQKQLIMLKSAEGRLLSASTNSEGDIGI